MPGSRTFTFLGTGTSTGVPMVCCSCEVCQSTHPRNHRFRCAVLVRTAAGNILIDTPPELRLQLLRERVDRLGAVLFTHSHADHLFGLDDLRPFAHFTGEPVPLYCTDQVEARIRQTFAYAFDAERAKVAANYLPKLVFHRITQDPFAVLGQTITPVPLLHAASNVFGFRFGDVAYCTDVSDVPDESWARLEGLEVLVLDALRRKPHPSHLSVTEALEVIERVKPRRAYLTHMSHDLEYEALRRELPPHVEPAHDGLSFEF